METKAVWYLENGFGEQKKIFSWLHASSKI